MGGYHYSTKNEKGEERPRMHTFFHYLGFGDYYLIEIWKEAWYEAGWYPVVLTLEAAQAHPIYKEFEHLFMFAENKLHTYDRMCFYRWLAMAMSGGGWMSDMDTLPLNIKV